MYEVIVHWNRRTGRTQLVHFHPLSVLYCTVLYCTVQIERKKRGMDESSMSEGIAIICWSFWRLSDHIVELNWSDFCRKTTKCFCWLVESGPASNLIKKSELVIKRQIMQNMTLFRHYTRQATISIFHDRILSSRLIFLIFIWQVCTFTGRDLANQSLLIGNIWSTMVGFRPRTFIPKIAI